MTNVPDESVPRIESPSAEVEHPAGRARMPGARRDEYTRMPTGPIGVESTLSSGPSEDVGMPVAQWDPRSLEPTDDNARLAPWALLAAIVALIASWFVGWGIPLAIISVVAAIMSLRRPVESRATATWALVLGMAATIFSLGWLVWAGMQFEQFG